MVIVFVAVTIMTIVLFVIWRLGSLYLYTLTLREEVRGTGNVEIFRAEPLIRETTVAIATNHGLLGNIGSNDSKGS